MPKPFRADIPIYFDQFHVRAPSVGVADNAALWTFRTNNRQLVEGLLRLHPPEVASELVRTAFVAGELAKSVARKIVPWTELALSFADGDPYRVDDVFLLAANPWLASAEEYLQHRKAAIGFSVLKERNLELLHTMYPQRVPTLTSIPCFHDDDHSALKAQRGRGRRYTVRRRVCCWATYCLAWALGSETDAVRWWGLIAPGHAWALSAYSALNRYGASKRRLVADLQRWGIIPNPIPRNAPKPNRPLARRYIEAAERAIVEASVAFDGLGRALTEA